MTTEQPKTENLAVDSTRMAGALMGIIESLTQTMEVEIECLSKQDFTGIETVREQKARLVRDYQNNVNILAARPDFLHSAPEDVRRKLRAGNEKLEDISQRNAAALRAAIGATQTLIHTVIDAVRKETKETDCYSDPRKMANMLGSYSPICKPVAVNRTA